MRDSLRCEIAALIGKVKRTDKPLTKELWDKPLTGPEVGLDSIDLVFLLLEVSDFYSIRFQHDDLVDYAFNSVEAIAERVETKIVH